MSCLFSSLQGGVRLHLINRDTGTTRIFATSMTFCVIEPVNAYDTDGALASLCMLAPKSFLTTSGVHRRCQGLGSRL